MSRILFFGTPAFAVPSLARLIDAGHEVVAVITQPDRARGRGQRVTWSPIKQLAVDRGLPVLQPTNLKDAEFLAACRTLAPDLAVVAAYGRLLPQVMLDIPARGFLNVHASLLPRWRGAAPIHRAILAGDAVTGITIMHVVLALDAGPMLAQESMPIAPEDTSEALEARLAIAGAGLLVATIDASATGAETAAPQDESVVTYAKRLGREDSPVDWSRSADDLHNQIRGLHPWPLATTTVRGLRVIIRRSIVDTEHTARFPHHAPGPAAPPGTLVEAHGERLVIATGAGFLRITEIQLEGRRAVDARAFINGAHVTEGDRFDLHAEAR